MARVTAEDCVRKVENRFDLVLLAAHRARAIVSGSELTVDRDNDKNPVVALREIADETVKVNEVRESLVSGLTRVVPLEESENEVARVAIEHAAQEEQLSEADMLRALQHDRDNAVDNRF